VWELKNEGNDDYSITTSEKWLKGDEFENMEYESDVDGFEE
jgi:hypothetical protein